MRRNENGSGRGRREFLKKGIAGLAGAAALPSLIGGGARAQESEPERKQQYPVRTLGKTGITVPVVSMGVMNADNPNLVKVALERGITYLDTAHYYQRGRNEEMVGSVIKDVPRDAFYLATKARASTVDRHTRGESEQAEPETVQSFIQKVELSLKRLQQEYVDILYLHSATNKEDVMSEHAVTAMQRLKKEGKIRFMGVSTHRSEHEVIDAAVESGVYDVVLTAYNFRMENRAKVEAAMAAAAAAGLGIVAMKTQAGVYWDKTRTKQINMSAALKWALQNKNVHTSIPGFTTFDQLETDLAVLRDSALTPEEREDLQLGEKTGMRGLYCRQCEICIAQCPHGLEIPTIMRSYMYAYGYRNLSEARETLSALHMKSVPCSTCDTCSVRCAQGFDIKDRVTDVARLRNVPADLLG